MASQVDKTLNKALTVKPMLIYIMACGAGAICKERVQNTNDLRFAYMDNFNTMFCMLMSRKLQMNQE